MLKAFHIIVRALLSSAAAAEPMHFEVNRTGGNHCCNWIQATGEITQRSAAAFEIFFKATQYVPHAVRLNSPGGSLFGGILLGEAFRKLGVSTEVGSSSADPSLKIGNKNLYSKEPGLCASACAYAFLGGVERSLDPNTKLGFHRFYTANSLSASSSKIFTGADLDETQRIAAGLLLYVVDMGVDARLLALASQAGPNEIRWLQPREAYDLRVVYEPLRYSAWSVEPYKGGAIAASKSNDGLRTIVAGCSTQGGPYVAIVDTSPNVDEGWLNQCRVMGAANASGINPVFGAAVPANNVSLSHLKGGGVTMRFQLPTRTPPLTSPKLLTFETGYPMACSTEAYQASSDNFVPAVRLALRNCY